FYLILFLFILYPGMAIGLKIPVTLYGMMLTIMAWNSWRCVQHFPLGILAVIGAVLFVASDSLLAINKFKTPIPYAGILIMTTYIFAQYFIVMGVKSRLD
ncbi:MAG: lysoplasmalogenase, partial [Saprospiraceae bacterium]